MCDTWLKQRPQRLKHLRWTIDGPDSSYSSLEIHICWKVDSEARMEPPIHTEYLRSGGAMILIFMVDGARAVSSFCMRSAVPRNEGWNRASGQRKRSLPMVITWPSGSSYDFSSDDDDAAVCISCSKSPM